MATNGSAPGSVDPVEHVQPSAPASQPTAPVSDIKPAALSEVDSTSESKASRDVDPARAHADAHTQGTTLAHDPLMHTLLDEDYEGKPSAEDLHTLRRVSGKINWAAYTLAFCETAERFSYYGSSVLYSNFVRAPLPEGSNTGAGWGRNPQNQSGALGWGQKSAQGISLFNQFFAYFIPLLGGWVADARLGRYTTIHIAIAISMVAHIVLVAASAPSVIVNTDSSAAAFLIGLISLGFGTGFFKANIAPLLADQNAEVRMRVETLKSGERVLIDPAITNTRIFLYFYLAINVGSFAGQMTMVYVQMYVGYWLAFLLPTILFVFAPIILFFNKKRYVLAPPTGSLLSKFFHVLGFVMRGKWTLNFARLRREFSWDIARPSQVPVEQRPAWMTYDDEWIDELRRGLQACKVFAFLPIFFLAYNQMTNNLTSQGSTMILNGLPNDLLQNLNPLSIIILVPIIDGLLYPGLRRMGVSLTPIKRMAVGFGFAAVSMVAAAVTQYYIYQLSPCGDHPSECEDPAPINVWVQSLPYILVGIAEIFTNTTSLEYAYSKAPDNMKSLVMSVNLFMSAVSAALGQAFTPLSEDPLLVINYAVVAGIAAVGGVAFWLLFRRLDSEEDMWNNLKKSEYRGQYQPNAAQNVPEAPTELKA